MGQTFIKNTLLYPTVYPDEQMKDIPFPRAELYDHVATKLSQVCSGVGVATGSGVALWKKRKFLDTTCKFGWRGFLIGVAFTPVMVEGMMYATKSGSQEQIYDRCYRIRYNDSQVRSAQWSTGGLFLGGLIGAVLVRSPATRLTGAANGAIIGYVIATVDSAVVPLKGRGTNFDQNAEKKSNKEQ